MFAHTNSFTKTWCGISHCFFQSPTLLLHVLLSSSFLSSWSFPGQEYYDISGLSPSGIINQWDLVWMNILEFVHNIDFDYNLTTSTFTAKSASFPRTRCCQVVHQIYLLSAEKKWDREKDKCMAASLNMTNGGVHHPPRVHGSINCSTQSFILWHHPSVQMWSKARGCLFTWHQSVFPNQILM